MCARETGERRARRSESCRMSPNDRGSRRLGWKGTEGRNVRAREGIREHSAAPLSSRPSASRLSSVETIDSSRARSRPHRSNRGSPRAAFSHLDRVIVSINENRLVDPATNVPHRVVPVLSRAFSRDSHGSLRSVATAAISVFRDRLDFPQQCVAGIDGYRQPRRRGTPAGRRRDTGRHRDSSCH